MRSLSAYGRGLRFLEGLRDGQEHLVGEVGEELPHLHRLFGGEVVLLGQLHRGVVQPLAEERERLHGVAKAEAVADELAAVLVADLARFIDEVGAAGSLGHILGDEGDEAAAEGAQALPIAFSDASVPGGLATAALKAAADAGEGKLSQRGVRLAGGGAASRHKAAEVFFGEAAVAARRAEGTDVPGVGPAPARGVVYSEQLAGLAQGDPACRE